MSGKIQLNSDELKNFISTLDKLNSYSLRNKDTLVVAVMFQDGKLTFYSQNDYALVRFIPENCEILEKITEDEVYFIDVTPITKLKYLSKEVILQWENEKSPLYLECGPYKATFNIATHPIEFTPIANKIPIVQIDPEIVAVIGNSLTMPYSYHEGKKDLTPIYFYSEDGKLAAQADDKFSFARVATEHTLRDELSDMDVAIPKYILSAIFGKPSKVAKIGVSDQQVLVENDTLMILFAGLNDEKIPFSTVHKRFKDTWLASFEFKAESLLKQIKPLTSTMDKKSKAGGVINMSILRDKLSIAVDSGQNSSQIEKVNDIEKICLENSSKNVVAYFHPTAFEDFTSLSKPLKTEVQCCVNKSVAYYKMAHKEKELVVEYLFPMVSV